EEPIPGKRRRKTLPPVYREPWEKGPRVEPGGYYEEPEYEQKKVWLVAGRANINWGQKVTDEGVTKHWGGLQEAHHRADMGWKVGGKEGHVRYTAIGEEYPEGGWFYGGLVGRAVGTAVGAGVGAYVAKSPAKGAVVGGGIGGGIGHGIGAAVGYFIENRYRGELHYEWRAVCDENGNVSVENTKSERKIRDAWNDNDARWR
ncbi:MAG: hypothetical protein ACYTFI_12360, partial [Planctomycetota bacterium]